MFDRNDELEPIYGKRLTLEEIRAGYGMDAPQPTRRTQDDEEDWN